MISQPIRDLQFIEMLSYLKTSKLLWILANMLMECILHISVDIIETFLYVPVMIYWAITTSSSSLPFTFPSISIISVEWNIWNTDFFRINLTSAGFVTRVFQLPEIWKVTCLSTAGPGPTGVLTVLGASANTTFSRVTWWCTTVRKRFIIFASAKVCLRQRGISRPDLSGRLELNLNWIKRASNPWV